MSDEKNLATIQRIEALDPIPGADKIERATIMGWGVVVRKGEFKVGDPCVYIQIDTIVPATKPFAFLEEHRRLKTKKLRGVLSQGLALPVEAFGEELGTRDAVGRFAMGMDVTEIIGVKKYVKEIPVTMQGLIKGNFPSFVPKTDEERIQGILRVLAELSNDKVYVTVKADGTSATYIRKDAEFKVCSRNFEKKAPVEGDEPSKKDIYFDMAKKYDLERKMLSSKHNLAIQGEIVGPGIQKNPMGLTENKLLVFNVYDIDKSRYLDIDEMLAVVASFGLEHVTIIYKGVSLQEIVKSEIVTVYDLLKLAEGNYEGVNTPREGIVIRPVTEKFSETLQGRLSFKVINNRYLLEVEE